MKKKPRCANCGKLKRIHGQGYCSNCYHKLGVNPRKVVCTDCCETRPHYAMGKCKSCYNKLLTYRWRMLHPDESKKRNRLSQQRRRSSERTKS